MHRLGTSVLMLIILPLAFSWESGQIKNQITEDYRNIIRIQLEHVEDIIEQLNSNCTVRDVSMSKEPKSTQYIHRKICKINRKLKRIERESENINGELKAAIKKLVKEIKTSLGCCHNGQEEQREGTKKPIQQIRKWKLCRVKDILGNLQRHFEQYNAYLALSRDLPERGKTSEQTCV